MIGLLSSFTAGFLAFVVSGGFSDAPGTRRRSLLAVTLLTAVAGYALATFLDFGGWQIFEFRGAAFSFLIAFSAAGISRLFSLFSEKQAREPS